MQDATQAVRCLTVLGRLTGVDLVIQLWPLTLRIARLVSGFRRGTLSPEAMFQFEADLQDLLRQAGRLIVQCLNPRPLRPERSALPGCATPRWNSRTREFQYTHSENG